MSTHQPHSLMAEGRQGSRRGGDGGRAGKAGRGVGGWVGGRSQKGENQSRWLAKPFSLVVGSEVGPERSQSPFSPRSKTVRPRRPCGREGLPGSVFPGREPGPVGSLGPSKATCPQGRSGRGGPRARARRRGRACLWCLEIKAAKLGLFLPLTLRHFYWRDEGRQSGPTVLA